MPEELFRHKNIRLTRPNYVGPQFYFITICCFNRRPFFRNPTRCEFLLQTLQSESASRGFAVHAYCAMPDHLHFLAEGLTSVSDLLNLILTIKMKTTRAHRALTPLWQKKFFDHVLRSTDSPEAIAWYIWMNPVRAGLATRVFAYSYAAAFTNAIPRRFLPLVWLPPWKQKTPASEGGRYNGAVQPHD